MNQDYFLNFFMYYPVVSYSLLKRAFRQHSLKEIKTLLREAESCRLIERHSYPGFDYFSLTTSGFENIQRNHLPVPQHTKKDAQLICAVNNLKYGANQEVSVYDKIQMERWVDGREFIEFPVVVGQEDKIQGIIPQGLMILKAGNIARAYFVHCWRSFKQVSKDLALYSQCQEDKDYIKRFGLPADSALRVLCLVSDLKVLENNPQLKESKGTNLPLFLPFSKAHYTNPLSSSIWLDVNGNYQRIFTP